MQDLPEKAGFFKILGDPTRLCIVMMLAQTERCACELLEHLSISQPTLSHHMKLLVQAGMVKTRRKATWTFYSLDPEEFSKMQDMLRRLAESDIPSSWQIPDRPTICCD